LICRGDAAPERDHSAGICYFLDAQDHVTSFKIFDLPDDSLARTEAEKLWRSSASHGFELGNGAKMIHREVKSASFSHAH
jgi:hypothetical protein